jgi:hypothetical protein
MTKSLKSYLPVLANALNEKEDTLYERQRALVRVGLLESLQGRGRGSGVRASPESVAMLMIGLLSTVSLSETGPLSRSLATAAAGGKCPLTGAKTFQAALTRILSDEALAKRVNDISVRVNAGLAIVAFDGGTSELDRKLITDLAGSGATKVKIARTPRNSIFLSKKAKDAGLRVSLSIGGETVQTLANIVSGLDEDPS